MGGAYSRALSITQRRLAAKFQPIGPGAVSHGLSPAENHTGLGACFPVSLERATAHEQPWREEAKLFGDTEASVCDTPGRPRSREQCRRKSAPLSGWMWNGAT
ncbi:hypothetical protein AAFF_G00143790 [Aldrovandia affinis]|uniref:Uncharacterized protein n=1 Tax=Aldrovandia affinis TaxID=143900 RepID=A0AAD7T0E5_9TELE|nr:hypothetical protein AAFF_G00143790 [Aldrovandia affinis]